MKKFIYITVVFMLMLVFIGCASMTPEQRKERYDLRNDVGNSQFAGSSNNLDARGMMQSGWW
jgi:ABC-type Fe3+-citrate transport system substrate-binding protein